MPQPVLKANGAFRGVRVGAGAHLVEMAYRPRGLVPGVALSLVTALALGAILARSRGGPLESGR